MLTTGRYKGNPVAEHLKHVDEITPEMFERWLTLWRETTADLLSPEAAMQLQAKAERIAESRQLALKFSPGQKSEQTSAVTGKRVSVREDHGGRGIIQQKNTRSKT